MVVVGPVAAPTHRLEGHPERPERIAAVLRGLADLELEGDLLVVEPEPAERADLLRVHTPEYLDRVGGLVPGSPGSGPVLLDPDTFLGADSWSQARLAAGAGMQAVRAAERHGVPAFVPARPPGHHALADRAMGFCLVNNVAVAAAALRAQGQRVLIVDWDVHHGNGTEALFWNDAEVLYVSTHQAPCYPGTGAATDVGGGAGVGTTLNVPLPPGATGDVLLQAFDQLVTPAVEAFAPSWVLVSAGFDAHRADPLAQLALSAGDFARLTAVVATYAPGPGRLVLFLEGGYDLDALRHSVRASLGQLLDAPTKGQEQATSGGPGRPEVEEIARLRAAALGEARK